MNKNSARLFNALKESGFCVTPVHCDAFHIALPGHPVITGLEIAQNSSSVESLKSLVASKLQAHLKMVNDRTDELLEILELLK